MPHAHKSSISSWCACASLDRNGLRPSRYKLTADGVLYIGSEAGAVVFDDSTIVRKGRLGPGQMLSANTATGEFKFDLQIKTELAQQQPYRRWIDETKTLVIMDFRPLFWILRGR